MPLCAAELRADPATRSRFGFMKPEDFEFDPGQVDEWQTVPSAVKISVAVYLAVVVL